MGPADQRGVEIGPVLVYTSDVLTEPLQVTGEVSVVLHAATSASDTDWTAKLVDVHPDGQAVNIADGIIRARYRDSLTEPVAAAVMADQTVYHDPARPSRLILPTIAA